MEHSPAMAQDNEWSVKRLACEMFGVQGGDEGRRSRGLKLAE